MNLISQVASRLKENGVVSDSAEAEAILGSILECRRIDLYTKDIKLDPHQLRLLEDMIMRRVKGEPLQYIIGNVDFYGNLLLVENGVFIPRPETEILVEAVAAHIDSRKNPTENELHILDLCTGSANIAIALTKTFPHCKIISSDISEKALNLAKKNALINCVIDRIKFIKSDIFEGLITEKEGFDIIVSNPPYIANHMLGGLSEEVKREPREALDGGDNGIGFYLRIINESPKFLKKDGLLALELADGIAEKVKAIFEKSTCFTDVQIFKDLNGINRVIMAHSLRYSNAITNNEQRITK